MLEKDLPERKRVAVLIPTYNEAATIGILLEQLQQVFLKTKWVCGILVIDGHSFDQTASIIRQKQEKYSNIHLLVEEKKEGIGAAYFKAFQWAHDARFDAVIEFDGDFQHSPQTIPQLLEALDDETVDLVLGTRKRKGGSYPANWDRLRLFFSRIGGELVRWLLFFPTRAFWKISDPTTGLKVTRMRWIARSLTQRSLFSLGFSYKIEMLYKMVQKGAKVVEIPFHFQSRQMGESKMTSQTPSEILKSTALLRLKDQQTRRFFKFAVVGLSGVLVNALMLEVFIKTSFVQSVSQFFYGWDGIFGAFMSQPAAWSAALSAECSILNNFLWNHVWTFCQRKDSKKLLVRLFSFHITAVGSILLQFCTVGLCTVLWGNSLLVRQIALMLTIVFLVAPYNWIMYSKVVWKERVLY